MATKTCECFALGINNKDKEVTILADYDLNDMEMYLEALKQLRKLLSPQNLREYKVVFNNHTFKNVLEFAESLLQNQTELIEQIKHPTPDTTHYKELGIIDIDYEHLIVTLEEAKDAHILNLIRNIPTLIGFKLVIGDKIYTNLSEFVKQIFEQKENQDDPALIISTNLLIDELCKEDD